MKMYFRGLSGRSGQIALIIAVVLFSLLLSYVLFFGSLAEISGQLNTYEGSDYSVLYRLNYSSALDNECLFPDADIQVFGDSGCTARLAVSCVMKEEGIPYDLVYLAFLKDLQSGKICVSKNVAEYYRIGIGDTLFAVTSYSDDVLPLTVSEIISTEYDYMHPSIGNRVGVVFLGNMDVYVRNTNSDFLLFSKQSRAEELAGFPQIIKTITNKSANEEYVAGQAVPALIVEAILVFAAIILSHILFFSGSRRFLFRCYLKGMKRCGIWMIPFAEKILFCVIPVIVFQSCTVLLMPRSCIREAYWFIPVMICLAYSCIMLVRDILAVKKKGT